MIIRGASRREDTVTRLGGNGDNWHMSWAADDTQISALCDGFGWSDPPLESFNSQLFHVVGGPTDARFEVVPGFPALSDDPAKIGDRARYYGFGTLAVDGAVYQFMSTFNHGVEGSDELLAFVGAKLVYSPDGGRTWHNQDGSTPVRWEPYDERSRQTMAFYEEENEAFSLLSIVQMGKDYAANTDGYVYVYSPNGIDEGTMNELVMFRVPKDKLPDRGAYEYFAGRRGDDATWSPDIEARVPVETFPRGWVNRTMHPYSWHPSITYNEPLGVYLMANWGMGCSPEGLWFGKPSYLGLYAAQNPWGPWEQFHEETAWTPGGDAGARAYQPQIAPKWIAPDGSSFWIVWTDFQNTLSPTDAGEEAFRQAAALPTVEERLRARMELMPYYSFNLQRVDLDLSS